MYSEDTWFNCVPANMKRLTTNLKINLIPQDPFFEGMLGRTLRWAVKVGRYIVIFTELIVIMSFATRFSLDRQITDLNQDITQKETIIRSYGGLENEIRAAQTKLDQYQQLEQQKNLVDVFQSLSQITPVDVKLSELQVKPASVTIAGTTLSQNSLNLLINNIQFSPNFFNVVVDRIETSEDTNSGLFFRISAATVRPENKTAAPREAEIINILDRTQGL